MTATRPIPADSMVAIYNGTFAGPILRHKEARRDEPCTRCEYVGDMPYIGEFHSIYGHVRVWWCPACGDEQARAVGR